MMKYTSFVLSILVAAALSFSSCGGDNEGPGGSSEDQLQAFFAENNISPQQTGSGLYYVIDNPGGEEKPTPTSTVTVIYRGYFFCLLYTSPSPRDQRGSRMPSSA